MKVKKELDGLGLAGVIVNLVTTGVESILAIILLISAFTSFRYNGGEVILVIFAAIILGSLSTIAIIFNAKVLAGEHKYKKVASVLGFICLSVLGSVLLIISNEEVVREDLKEESLAETLTKFKALLDNGAINEEEFTALKRNLIK